MSPTLAELFHQCSGYLRAGGWLMLPLGLIAFWMWLQYLLLLSRLREARQHDEPSDLRLDGDLRTAAALDACARHCASLSGAVPRILVHTVARVRAGQAAETAFAQCRRMELGEYRNGMLALSALVAAAPLIGLLGTVFGMIRTFVAVSQRSGDVAAMVADGVSMALITTQAGLVAALIGTFGLAHLSWRYQHLRNQAHLCGAGFLRGIGAGSMLPSDNGSSAASASSAMHASAE
jgi:biopolymer transport protein ExbB